MAKPFSEMTFQLTHNTKTEFYNFNFDFDRRILDYY